VGVVGIVAVAVAAGALLVQPARTMTAAPPVQADLRPAVMAEQPWARAAMRPSDVPGGTSAVYMTLRNTGSVDDRLLGAWSDAAETTEVHRTTVDGGVMRMRPAGPLDLPVGGALTLEPGGLHVMLINLRRDLVVGEWLTVTLQMEQAGDVVVDAEVRAPMSGPMSKPMHGG